MVVVRVCSVIQEYVVVARRLYDDTTVVRVYSVVSECVVARRIQVDTIGV